MCALKAIKKLCRAGTAAHESGDVLNAEFHLHQAYIWAKGLNLPVLEAKILNTIAVFAIADHRPTKAVSMLHEAREKVEARVGRNNKLYRIITDNLVQAKAAVGRKAAA